MMSRLLQEQVRPMIRRILGERWAQPQACGCGLVGRLLQRGSRPGGLSSTLGQEGGREANDQEDAAPFIDEVVSVGR